MILLVDWRKHLVFLEAKSTHDLLHKVQHLADLAGGLGGQAEDVAIILHGVKGLGFRKVSGFHHTGFCIPTTEPDQDLATLPVP